jgi:hypothetical protein
MQAIGRIHQAIGLAQRVQGFQVAYLKHRGAP